MLDKTFQYEYNISTGNLESVTTRKGSGTPTTTTFGYTDTAHPDRLTSFGGKAITYNANGGVASYDGWNYTWNKGKLSSIRKNLGSFSRAVITPILGANKTYSFSYNGLGQRIGAGYTFFSEGLAISPVQNGEVTNYSKQFVYDQAGRLISEAVTGEKHAIGSFSYTLKYLYDESGIIGAQYTSGVNTNTYYFLRNLQGDVVAIYDTNGAKVVEYSYDAWGNCTINSTTTNYAVAHANPIRYRGYYYDEDTKLYYLNSRYYSPEFRRFISPDDTAYLDPESVNGLNLYAYCNNDPVNYCDPSGHAPEWLKNLITGVGIVVGTALFVAAIIASAGAVGALVGVGAAAIGLSTTAVSTAITIATISTYVVAGGVGLFGANDAIEAFSGGINPIRDYVMGGNQVVYNIVNASFNTLGTIAVITGMVAPKVLQKIAQYGGKPKISQGKTVGYDKDFFDKNGDWSFRIDATTHGNPNYHHNPHYHVVTRGGDGTAVYYLWEIIKEMFK